jgi:very-short-patch-repair endonuclease
MLKKRRAFVSLAQIMLVVFALPSLSMFFAFSWISPVLAGPYLIFGLVLIVLAISLESVAHEKSPLYQRNFSYEESKSPIITPQAIKLSEALRNLGIHNELEHGDGSKHVDIYVPEARLCLEIDGEYHLTDPEQVCRDLDRASYSHLDGKDTMHIPNFYVDNYLDKIANTIAEVVRKRARL